MTLKTKSERVSIELLDLILDLQARYFNAKRKYISKVRVTEIIGKKIDRDKLFKDEIFKE